MAEPITWRSIRGPSLAEASRPLEAAQQSITGAFDKFAGMLREREAINQGVLDKGNEAKVQTFLDRLQGAATPEQVAAMRSTGELDALRAALNPADRARVRGAEEARTTALRQGIVAENAFNDLIQARQRAPLINQAKMFVANRDRAGLQKFLAENDLGDESTFMASLDAAERAVLTQAHEDKQRQWETDRAAEEALLRPLTRQAKELGVTASEEQIKASRENRNLAKMQREQLAAAAKVEAENAALREKGNTYAIDGVFSPARIEELNKTMVGAGIGDDSDARAEIIKRIAAVAATHGSEIPMSEVKQAVLASKGGNFWNTDNDWADYAEENLLAAMQRKRPVQLADGTVGEANAMAADLQEWMRNRSAAITNPAPVSTKKR